MRNIIPLSGKCKHYHTRLVHPKCFVGYQPPKVLFLDIETSPARGYFWQIYDTNILKVDKQWRILCIGYKWLGGKTKVLSGNEKRLCRKIRDLVNKADIVVAHNGDKFDLRKIHTRIAFYRLDPPARYRSYDTLKRIKKFFGLLSNKLGDIGIYFGIGNKLETGGKELWFDYMAGKREAKRKMHRYCANDVDLLGKVYIILQPWEQR